MFDLGRSCFILFDIVRSCFILFDLVRSCSILFGLVRYCSIWFDLVRYCSILFGLGRSCSVLFGLVLSCHTHCFQATPRRRTGVETTRSQKYSYRVNCCPSPLEVFPKCRIPNSHGRVRWKNIPDSHECPWQKIFF